MKKKKSEGIRGDKIRERKGERERDRIERERDRIETESERES